MTSTPAEPLRVMPHLRYLNAFEGRRVERWQYKNEREPLVDIGTRGKTWSGSQGVKPAGRRAVPDYRGWSPARVTRCMTRRKPS